MPTYRVTDPSSGRVLRLTGDSPPTQQELEELFSQFSVSEEPDIDPQIMSKSPVQQQRVALDRLAAEQGPLDAAAIAAGRGMTTLGRGLGIVDPETEQEKAAFRALERESPVATTVGEVAGQTAPFLLPGAALARPFTVGGRVAQTGTVGATEAGLITKGEGGEDADVLKGAGVGGTLAGGAEVVLPVIGRLVSKLYRKVTGSAPSAPLIEANGRPTAEMQEVLKKAGIDFEDLDAEAIRLLQSGDALDPTAVSRKAFLESQGITPTRAQVTGKTTDFRDQQELAKTTNRVEAALKTQEEQLGSRFENAITATGGSANRSTSTAFDYIADRSIDQDAAISLAYKQARAAAPTEKVVKLDGLTESMRSIAGSDKITGGLVNATRDILRNKGVLGNKGLTVQGRITPEVAEEIRIEMNSLYNSLSPFGREKLRGLKDALDNDVAAAVGQDIFKDARSAKAAFESSLSRGKTNKFDQRRKELVRDILANKVDPDRFLEQTVLSRSSRSADVGQLKKFLLKDGDEAGLAAWNDLRAEALQHIRDKAFKEVAGEAALSRAGLQGVLDSIGGDKLKVLFSGDELKFLSDMLKTSKLREPVRGTQQGLGPSAQAVSRLENVVKRIPILAQVFEGLATDAAGRVALRSPTLKAPLKPLPAPASALLPAAAALSTQEQ